MVGNKHLEHIFGCSPSKKRSCHPKTKKYACVHMGTVWERLVGKGFSPAPFLVANYSFSFSSLQLMPCSLKNKRPTMNKLMHLRVVLRFFSRSERFCEIVGQEASKSRNLNCSQSTTTRWAVSNEGQHGGVERLEKLNWKL